MANFFILQKRNCIKSLKRFPLDNHLLAVTIRLLTLTINLLAVLLRLLAFISLLLALDDDLLAERENYPFPLHQWVRSYLAVAECKSMQKTFTDLIHDNHLLAVTIRLLTPILNLLAVLFRLLALISLLLALDDDLLAERENYPFPLNLWISYT